MQNTIGTRIFDFLKAYAPFSFMEPDDLMYISERIIVAYFSDGDTIFLQDESTKDRFYVVQQGAIELFREQDSAKTLVDTCDEGDIFGLRPLIASESYALTAIAKEEAMLYAIPTGIFLPILEKTPKVNSFLTSSFAAGVRNPLAKNDKGRLFNGRDVVWDKAKELIEVQIVDTTKAPVCCLASYSVQQAARIMRDKGVGSIIVVDDGNHPKGIVTDKDLRNKIVTGELPIDTLVSDIMSSPVICIEPNSTIAEVQIVMIDKGVHHLCITEDGTIDTEVKGVVSEHELLVIQGNSPAVLIKAIKRSKNGQHLKYVRDKAESLLRKYLEQEVSIAFISNIMSKINDGIIIRCLELAEKQLEANGQVAPPVSYCWLALGSEGREEQLLRTDQDNALVFDNVSEEDYQHTKNYFLALAKMTTDLLFECGYEYCPADMMASNPKWCLSLEEWKNQFSNWISKPGTKEIMYTTIFFDYRPIYGDFELAKSLTQSIYEYIDKQEIFLSFLAKNALQNPTPLTFFRNFVVERNGEHKDEFDIKARAMMPLTDAARLLILEAKQSGKNNTFQRFDHMAQLEPQNKELYEQAADAYEILMRFRALQGLSNKDSGRFFNPSELNKMQRLLLRGSFKPIKDLQDLISVRFRLNMLS